VRGELLFGEQKTDLRKVTIARDYKQIHIHSINLYIPSKDIYIHQIKEKSIDISLQFSLETL